MAVSNNTTMANRYGLETEIFDADATEFTDPLLTIDFANISEIALSSDRVFATGGQSKADKVPFDNPFKGTFKLSTQLMSQKLLALMAGDDVSSFTATSVTFANNKTSKCYLIKSKTVWKDEDGTTYSEDITFHKVSPQRALNISYTGDGDPVSIDVVFDILENDDGEVITIAKSDIASGSSGT